MQTTNILSRNLATSVDTLTTTGIEVNHECPGKKACPGKGMPWQRHVLAKACPGKGTPRKYTLIGTQLSGFVGAFSLSDGTQANLLAKV